MKKKKIKFLTPFLFFAVLFFSNVSWAAMLEGMLTFSTDDEYADFLVSYDGENGPLVGSAIPIAVVTGDGTPLKDGVSLYIINGSLDFRTGDIIREALIDYQWDTVNSEYTLNSVYTLTGTILKEGIGPLDYTGDPDQVLFHGEILRGTFAYFLADDPDTIPYSPYLRDPGMIPFFYGYGFDEKAEELIGFYGISNNIFGSQIYMELCRDETGCELNEETLAFSFNNGLGEIYSDPIPELESDYNVLKLTSGEESFAEFFGLSVSISGDYAIVGAPGSGGPLVAGAAYILERGSSGWTQVAKLTASDGLYNDGFGQSVSISGGTAIVGAPSHPYTPAGGPGIPQIPGPGAAYIFELNGSGWTQVAKLAASDGVERDEFGMTVSISGDYAIVGARNNSAYIFERNSGVWPATEDAILTASASGDKDNFGFSVSISGNTAIVGDTGWGYTASADPPWGPGAAYIFERDGGGTWTETDRLTASDGAPDDRLGWSVSISGDNVIVGARMDDDNGDASGSAYIFKRLDGVWTQDTKLTASDGERGDIFGESVSISVDYAIVSARGDDDNKGSAYIFERCVSEWTQMAKLTAYDGVGGELFGISASIFGDTAIVGMTGSTFTRPIIGSAYIYYRTPVFADTDNDGIEDSIDFALTTFSDTFTDSNTPVATSGTITYRGDQRLTVTDEPNPAGVLITANCGTEPATVSVCGGSATFTLNDSNKVLVTCGSVTIKNLSGPAVNITFVATDGSQAITSVGTGDSLTFEPTTFTITTPETNTADTVVLVDGKEITIKPGESVELTIYIVIDDCDTGVPDQIYNGKLITEWIDDCAKGAKNHGKFLSCVAELTNNLKKAGLITGAEKGAIQNCSAHADIP